MITTAIKQNTKCLVSLSQVTSTKQHSFFFFFSLKERPYQFKKFFNYFYKKFDKYFVISKNEDQI